MQHTSSSARQPQTFPPTRWSVVLAAGRGTPTSAGALETICRSYWYPLYAYVRRRGFSGPDAQDLTQEFFHQLLQKRWLETADRQKGKLRTFLIVALKKFMAKEWRRVSAQKRGGGQVHIPIDPVFAESQYAADSSGHLGAEAVFDQQWALVLIELAVDRLCKEYAAAGKSAHFAVMKECLMAERGKIDYASVAGRLGASEGAARVAVHRFRKRFRQVFREELAQTLSDGADVNEELLHLVAALGDGKTMIG